MLIPNLSVLLAERRLTLSKVSQDTGLSRTTLTALTSRTARGIQLDTLNRLCQYLRVTPDALFIYRPFDLSLACAGLPGHSEITFTFTSANHPAEVLAMACDAEAACAPDGALDALRVRLSMPEATDRDRRLAALVQALPPSALADLERDILAAFDANIDPLRAPRDYAPDLRWPWDASV